MWATMKWHKMLLKILKDEVILQKFKENALAVETI
jgi:hypothetical protein